MKISFFDARHSGRLLREFIALQPKKGRGMVKSLALKLGVASPQISQYLSGDKVPSIDHAYQIADYFKWTELETEYFLTLVELERASHHGARKHFAKKLDRIKQESLKLSSSVTNAQELDDKQKARFYSSWVYSAIRLWCSLGEGRTHAELARAFPEFESELNGIIEFLLEAQLLKRVGHRYEMGVSRTFVAKGSPFLPRHHSNWRTRAMERAPFIDDDELMFTAPLSISAEGYKLIRRELQDWVKSLSTRLNDLGDAEEVVCLNLDVFRVTRTR